MTAPNALPAPMLGIISKVPWHLSDGNIIHGYFDGLRCVQPSGCVTFCLIPFKLGRYLRKYNLYFSMYARYFIAPNETSTEIARSETHRFVCDWLTYPLTTMMSGSATL